MLCFDVSSTALAIVVIQAVSSKTTASAPVDGILKPEQLVCTARSVRMRRNSGADSQISPRRFDSASSIIDIACATSQKCSGQSSEEYERTSSRRGGEAGEQVGRIRTSS